jgi:hypothetical protein
MKALSLGTGKHVYIRNCKCALKKEYSWIYADGTERQAGMQASIYANAYIQMDR